MIFQSSPSFVGIPLRSRASAGTSGRRMSQEHSAVDKTKKGAPAAAPHTSDPMLDKLLSELEDIKRRGWTVAEMCTDCE